jgi:excisionase family DNA binding protein
MVSDNSQTRARSLRFFPFSHIQYQPFPSVSRELPVARVLRYSRIMEAAQSYPNLLSEKQAAKRLGVARITLLRAREAGRIRFFRIGTRVLYCAEHLTEFLNACERNRPRPDNEAKSHAPRKENRVSAARGSVRERDSRAKTDSRKKEQAPLPFAVSR